MKVAFLGTPHFAEIVLEKLATTQYKPSLVITGRPTKSGRSLALTPTLVELAAKKYGIRVSYELKAINETFDLAILVAFGKIIPKNILEKPRLGFLNVHPSLLPAYRGPSPIQSAILNGETRTGVTIMKLDEKLDHGPVLGQVKTEITNTNTHKTMIEKLGNLGSDLLLELLPDYLNGSLVPKDQDHNQATFTKRIEKQDGLINLQNPPDPNYLQRLIRAYYPWPAVWFKDQNKMYKLLPENKIQPEGKQPMTISQFKNGNYEIYKKLENLIQAAATEV